MKMSKGEKIANIVVTVFLILVSIVCIAPMIHMLAVSLSSNAQAEAGNVYFWPKDFTLNSYTYLMSYVSFWKSMGISVVRVGVSLVLVIFLTITMAYPLSKSGKKFPGRGIFAWIVFLTMLVNGGLIPNYLVISSLHLTGTIWALVLPGSVSAFYIMLMLNFFRGIPDELEEVALLDGANQWQILFKIFLPLAVPCIATICVYCSLGVWNEWFNGIIYMNNPSQYPLMSYLQSTVLNTNVDSLSAEERQKLASVGNETYQAAQMFIAAIPMICVYPFMQKYFVKGLTVGSVKG